MRSATVEELATAYKAYHTKMVEHKATHGGMYMDHACCAILAKVCNLAETVMYSTLYYYNLVNPLPEIKRAFKQQGLTLRYTIKNRSYFFSVALANVAGTYTVRVPFPHPAAIFQPSCETVH